MTFFDLLVNYHFVTYISQKEKVLGLDVILFAQIIVIGDMANTVKQDHCLSNGGQELFFDSWLISCDIYSFP